MNNMNNRCSLTGADDAHLCKATNYDFSMLLQLADGIHQPQEVNWLKDWGVGINFQLINGLSIIQVRLHLVGITLTE